MKTPFLVGCILRFSLIRIYIFSYLFCKAEKSKDVGDHWNSLQYQRHGKEMEVIHFSFQRLSYFKIWSGWISATQKRGGEFCNNYEYTKKKWPILEPGFNAVLNFASNTGFSTHFHCWIVHCLKPWFIITANFQNKCELLYFVWSMLNSSGRQKSK